MKRPNFRHITDKFAAGVITGGGIALIVIILGIMSFIAYQVLPLWRTPAISEAMSSSFSESFLFVGVEENHEMAFGIAEHGEIVFFKPGQSTVINRSALRLLKPGEKISVVSEAFGRQTFSVGTSEGRLIEFEIKFNTTYESQRKIIIPEVIETSAQAIDLSSIKQLSYDSRGEFAATSGTNLIIGLKDENDSTQIRREAFSEKITALAIRPLDRTVFVAYESGQIEIRSLSKKEIMKNRDGIAISAMNFLIGDMTLVVAGAEGKLEGYLPIKDQGQTFWRAARKFENSEGTITQILPSWRNKCFTTRDSRGHIKLYHATTERLLADWQSPIAGGINLSPKSDGILVQQGQAINFLHVNNPHPETNATTFFGKNLYEGYDEASYTWQSTGGTDDFEPKMSLVPLIFGTLKATLYAVLLAAPLGILGALYVSQFAHPRIRVIMKPTVEIMAALPSVVIGFLAGLWLAPILKNVIVEIFFIMIIFPLVLIAFAILFDKLPKKWTDPFRYGYEVIAVVPALFLTIAVGYGMGSFVESAVMHGDFQNWLYSAMEIRMDQRNSMVVGIAMSFAVLPIIFTISEDAMSSVPRHLTSASLALGATRWQTAVLVVLPAASAGIFSSVMIGLGRAVGETMIVLMATGNTPIMDWSVFNGMRTLSANIAVEITEAPEGGTLYRTLFLSGLMLFTMTFTINTVAEWIRARLRKKYAML